MPNSHGDRPAQSDPRPVRRFWRSPLLRLVAVVLVLEFLLFQWPAFVEMPAGGIVKIPVSRTVLSGFTRDGPWPQRLIADDSGTHSVTVSLSGLAVRSVSLDISSNGKGPVTYQLAAQIKGSDYFRDLAKSQVANGVDRSRYLLVRPEGPVEAIRITFDVRSGEQLHLNRLDLNRRIPYLPNHLRILLLLAIGGLVQALFAASVFLRKASPQDIGQRILLFGVGFVLFASCMWLTTAAATFPFFNVSQYDGDLYNKELVDALIQDRFELMIEPDPRLLALDNPYDPVERATLPKEDVLWDAALFNGRYYVSFGVVPAVLLMAPFKEVSGYYFQTPWAVFLFGGLALMFLLKNLRRFLFVHFPDLSFRYHFVLCLVMPALSYVGWALARPKFYEVTLLGGFFFLMLGIDQLMAAVYGHQGRADRSLFREAIWATHDEPTKKDAPAAQDAIPIQPLDPARDRISAGHLFFAVVSMTVAIGCDPTYAAFLLPLGLILVLLTARAIRTKQVLEIWIFSLVAFGIAAVPLALYNQARFGDYFVFGDRFRLTVSDLMTRPWFSPDRLLPGLGHYLVNPPIISAQFPFVHFPGDKIIPDQVFLAIDGRTIGLLTFPFIAILLFLPIVWRALSQATRTLRGIFFGSLTMSILLILWISLRVGSLGRQTVLFAIWLAVPAMIVWLLWGGTRENGRDDRHFSLFLAAGLITLFLCSMIFLQGENDRIEQQTPLFFEQLHRTLSVWLP